jgi:LPXTG-motif cell wall-anchored protein
VPYCRNCGHEIGEDSRFCPRCGASVTSVTTRAYTPTIPIMLFVLGLFLIAIGVVVEMPTKTTMYPWGAFTVHPYESQAGLLIFIGIIALVAAFILARRKKKIVS